MGGASSRQGARPPPLSQEKRSYAAPAPRTLRYRRASSRCWFLRLGSEEGPPFGSASPQDTERRQGPECGPAGREATEALTPGLSWLLPAPGHLRARRREAWAMGAASAGLGIPGVAPKPQFSASAAR